MKRISLGEARANALASLERIERQRIKAAAKEYDDYSMALAREVAEYIRSHPITDWNAWAEKLAFDSCQPGALGEISVSKE